MLRAAGGLVPAKSGERERLKPEAKYDKIVFEFEPKRLAIG